MFSGPATHTTRLVLALLALAMSAQLGSSQTPTEDPVQGYQWDTVPDTTPAVSYPIVGDNAGGRAVFAVARLLISPQYTLVAPQMEFQQILPPDFVGPPYGGTVAATATAVTGNSTLTGIYSVPSGSYRVRFKYIFHPANPDGRPRPRFDDGPWKVATQR